MAFLTDDFKSHMAQQFVESFDESANTIYYMFAAKTTAFENASEILTPPKSVTGGFYKLYEDIIFAKHITPDDVSLLIRNVKWEIGNSYEMYDDRDDDLQEKNFFVISHEPNDVYSVFKCIQNGKLVRDEEVYIPPVFDQPLSTETFAGDEYYRTADGYVWKLMTVLNGTEYNKYATEKFAPVTINTDIADNAFSGAIETILVESDGSQYNSYAYGSVKQSEIAGNPKILSLQTDNNLDILTYEIQNEIGTFIADHNSTTKKNVFFKKEDGSTWTSGGVPVSATIYTINSSIVRILLNSNVKYPNDIKKIFQTSNNVGTGTIITSGVIVDIRRDLIPSLSSNTDFYKNNSFYIRSGRGAGQVRNISEYIVTGNERRILIDTPFDLVPDSTSRFEIGPRVVISGDGTGADGTGTAKAIVNINPAGNTINSIEMVDIGTGYTYANALVQGNTGFIDVLTDVSVSADSAIVRPIIPPVGGHGSDIISELGASAVGVSIRFNGSEGGLLPTQNDYRTVGILSEPRFANTEFTIADTSLFFFDGETVVQPENGATAEVSNRSGNTLRVRNIRGFFEVGKDLSTVRSDNNFTTVINSIDRQSNILDQRTKFSVEITNTGTQGTGFIMDETVTQETTEAIGTVYSKTTNRIDLVGVRGIWNVSDDAAGVVAEMVGSESGAVAKITGKVEGDITPNTGKIFYVENFSPIARANNQVEDIKLTLEF